MKILFFPSRSDPYRPLQRPPRQQNQHSSHLPRPHPHQRHNPRPQTTRRPPQPLRDPRNKLYRPRHRRRFLHCRGVRPRNGRDRKGRVWETLRWRWRWWWGVLGVGQEENNKGEQWWECWRRSIKPSYQSPPNINIPKPNNRTPHLRPHHKTRRPHIPPLTLHSPASPNPAAEIASVPAVRPHHDPDHKGRGEKEWGDDCSCLFGGKGFAPGYEGGYSGSEGARCVWV